MTVPAVDSYAAGNNLGSLNRSPRTIMAQAKRVAPTEAAASSDVRFTSNSLRFRSTRTLGAKLEWHVRRLGRMSALRPRHRSYGRRWHERLTMTDCGLLFGWAHVC